MATGSTISNKAYRVISLMQALPTAPRKITSHQLHQKLSSEGHDITHRSVERYLKELSASQEFGSLVRCDDSSKPYGWSIAKEQHISIPAMNSQMAATWYLVHRYLKPIMAKDTLIKLEPVFQEARNWFKRHRPSGKRFWSDKVAYVPRGFTLQPAKVAPGITDQVYDALHRNRQMNIWYKNDNNPRRVHPYALVDRSAVRYLIVKHWNFNDYRHLSLDQIVKVNVLDEEVNDVGKFDLNGYLRSGAINLPYGKTIHMTLRFIAPAGEHLFRTPINDTQTLEKLDSGDIKLSAEVEYTDELKWWILGFGSYVEVISPDELREDIASEVATAHSYYSP